MEICGVCGGSGRPGRGALRRGGHWWARQSPSRRDARDGRTRTQGPPRVWLIETQSDPNVARNKQGWVGGAKDESLEGLSVLSKRLGRRECTSPVAAIYLAIHSGSSQARLPELPHSDAELLSLDHYEVHCFNRVWLQGSTLAALPICHSRDALDPRQICRFAREVVLATTSLGPTRGSDHEDLHLPIQQYTTYLLSKPAPNCQLYGIGRLPYGDKGNVGACVSVGEAGADSKLSASSCHTGPGREGGHGAGQECGGRRGRLEGVDAAVLEHPVRQRRGVRAVKPARLLEHAEIEVQLKVDEEVGRCGGVRERRGGGRGGGTMARMRMRVSTARHTRIARTGQRAKRASFTCGGEGTGCCRRISKCIYERQKKTRTFQPWQADGEENEMERRQ
ncbi:hypothetical protein B0H17DRAFT_1177542 [Mycena rosella]|uniref:Uncharacterized protein n=1 Tax=Mycena rosella TaxID=1033263 RepID=A0AAD7DS91_MYCRO|nr:hypothetical protein B0H17DRAFT_1177542 [Mycena rosella]